jgi:hypothetical protein
VALLVNGRVTAVGTHSQLMATEPGYQDLLASRADVSAANDTEARPVGGPGRSVHPPTKEVTP